MWKIQPRGLFNCHLTGVVTRSKSKHHRMNGPHAHLKQRYSSWPPCKSWFAAYCQHGNRYITLKASLKFLLTWLSVSQEYPLGLGVFLIPLSPVFILFFPLLWHMQVKKHLFNTFETSFNINLKNYTLCLRSWLEILHVLESSIKRHRIKDSCKHCSASNSNEKAHVHTATTREFQPNKKPV